MGIDEAGGGFRVERDSLGEVRVPADARWGPQTQRAVENFPISGERIPRALVASLGMVKAAAARVNGALGVLPPDVADAIAAAADEVVEGGHDDQFPVDVFQTGSGTSTNMNANEVIASLATQRLGRNVHPNDEVNASQSSNDVFPTAVHVAAAHLVRSELLPALDELGASLIAKSQELDDVVTAGRTHLMDAVPVTLGQVFGGYAAQVQHGHARVEGALPRLCELPLGGTAVGSGLNAVDGFADAVIRELAGRTGLPLLEAPDHFEAQGARDSLVELSGQLRTVAVSLTKVANDLRWRSSGPRAGLAEIHLPDLQPGSSIMPGKVNPVVPEAVCQVCAQVVGNDAAVAFAGAAGTFELNVMIPVMARNVLESARLLANAARLLAHRCVDGIAADAQRCLEYAESSPAIVTALNRYLGYDAAASVAKLALARRATIRQTVLDEGYVGRGVLTEAQLDEALDVRRMARGG
jgi:fumarate hydratase class II